MITDPLIWIPKKNLRTHNTNAKVHFLLHIFNVCPSVRRSVEVLYHALVESGGGSSLEPLLITKAQNCSLPNSQQKMILSGLKKPSLFPMLPARN